MAPVAAVRTALFFLTVSGGSRAQSHVVFIHYHKTGSYLARQLKNAILNPSLGLEEGKRLPHLQAPPSSLHQAPFPQHNPLSLKKGVDHAPGTNKRTCICQAFNCDERNETSSIDIWTAPDLSLRLEPLPPCYAYVHMVRDPARWTLSFYDYHRGEPGERWDKKYVPICSLAHAGYAAALSLTKPLLNATVAACAALVTPGWSLNQHLRRLPEADGLRLTGLLNILGGGISEATGDLARSAANLRTLRSSKNSAVRFINVFMDDFIAEPRVPLAEIAEFVVDLTLGDETQARRSAANTSLANRLVQQQTAKLSNPTGHMTTFRRSRDEKEALLRRHESDPVLAPTYLAWRRLFGLAA
jgi:hypothetical protein